MINPTQVDVGRGVIYQGGHPDDREAGVLRSFNSRPGIAFVVYGRNLHPQATSFDDLIWEFDTTRHEVDASPLYDQLPMLTDNEIELLRRMVADRVGELEQLPKWAQITGGEIMLKKLPLTKQLAEKLGEPDYMKEIY